MQNLEQYLYEHIPITKALGAKVVQDNLDKVVLSAPLKENINHKKTVFGGSLHAMATLSCWSMLYINLLDLPKGFEIVISHSEVDYLHPVTDDFTSTTVLDHDQEEWRQFLRRIKRHKKARYNLQATIEQNGITALQYTGTFVVIRN